jgi:hypothetical protein
MKKALLVLALLATLSGLLLACGATPEPTELPPTQTPWIIVVTATAGPGGVGQVQATQTPWIVVTTPTAAAKKTSVASGPAATATAASPTGTLTATAAATATSKPTKPTDTPDASTFKYPPPALLEPPNQRPVSWKSTVLLQWSSVGKLAADEYYHLHLERRPTTPAEQWYGDYVYTKEPQYLADADFLAPFHPPAALGRATVYWWVRVVRKTGEDEDGKPIGVDISAYSEERTLKLDAKPEG